MSLNLSRLTPFVVAPYQYLSHQVDMMVGMVLVVEVDYGGASVEALDVTTEELRGLFGGIGQVIYYIFSFELLAFKFSLKKKKINVVFIQVVFGY